MGKMSQKLHMGLAYVPPQVNPRSQGFLIDIRHQNGSSYRFQGLYSSGVQ